MGDPKYTGNEIAVIGMGCRFPEANSIYELWTNLKSGKESIRFFEDSELLEQGVPTDELRNPNFVKAHGYLEKADYFDNAFFGYSEGEALIMDPQMRVMHEVVWETLEDAGYNPDSYKKRIGLYAGGSDNLYWQIVASAGEQGVSDGFKTFLLSNKDFLATQIAYKLNLRGPVLDVSTACSTSLVAIHLACQALLNSECEIAVAGGVNVSLPLKQGYLYEKGMVLSPDGHCRAFDEKAEGFVSGNGAAAVTLKLLEDALADGDHIYAVIKGSAINNDGSRKVGYTAPSVDGQAEVIRQAHIVSEVDADSISYIEAHGTGTGFGDLVEISALQKVFGNREGNPCNIGSIKANFGHLDFAAGAAGFIKTVLMLYNKQIPPLVHFNQLNSKIINAQKHFHFSKQLLDWVTGEEPRRAGVSAFGIGGTNAHIVLEEAPLVPKTDHEDWNLFVLSAKTRDSLDLKLEQLQHYLASSQAINPADVAYTLQVGRKEFPYRWTVVAPRINELTDEDSTGKWLGEYGKSQLSETKPTIIYLLTGQVKPENVAVQYQRETVFRKVCDACRSILQNEMSIDLTEMLSGNIKGTNKDNTNSDYSILVSFVLQLAQAKLLMSWGIQPDRTTGYGTGQYVSAYLSGKWPLREILNHLSGKGDDSQSLDGAHSESLAQSTSLSTTDKIRETTELNDLLDDPSTIVLIIGEGYNEISAALSEEKNKRVHQTIDKAGFPASAKEDLIAWAWRLGVPVEFEKIHNNRKRSRLSLPTYPFNGRKFWINKTPAQLLSSPQPSAISKPEDCFYAPRWVRTGIQLKSIDREKATWILFADTLGVSKRTTEYLGSHKKDIVIVEAGEQFKRINSHAYVIDPSKQEDYVKLLDSLIAAGISIESIAHFWSLNQTSNVILAKENFYHGQTEGLFSLLLLAKSLGEHKTGSDISLYIVTEQGHAVLGTERMNPNQATSYAVNLVLPQEHSHIRCKNIDITLPEKNSEKLFRNLAAELTSNNMGQTVALRGGFRWVLEYEAAELPDLGDPDAEGIKRNGIYLITGGTGSIGLQLAKRLIQRYNARVALTGRTPFPPQHEWDNWLNSNPAEEKNSKAIRMIQSLGALSSNIMVLKADSADENEMETVFQTIESTWGPVNGVIHSVTVSNSRTFRLIEHLELKDCEEQFHAKALGLLTLEKILINRQLDWFLVMSSISSALGGIGHTAYIAANLFMDAFVQRKNLLEGANWKSICWSEWADDGTGTHSVSGAVLEANEAMNALERVVSQDDIYYLYCSPIDLNERSQQWTRPSNQRQALSDEAEENHLFYERPDLLSPYVPPRNKTEEAIMDKWKKIFRLKQVGIQDDFFDLGGDSLLAITAIQAIYKQFDVEISLSEFFDLTTIERLAQYVEGARQTPQVYTAATAGVKNKNQYLLSSAQKRLYFLNQYDPSLTLYNLSYAFLIEGMLDVTRFENALTELIHRHEILRTSFAMIEDEPVQIIHQTADFQITVLPCNEDDFEETIQGFIKSFDLSKAPLFRVALLKKAEQQYYVIFDLHHIISDGISIQIMISEFLRLYNGEHLPQVKVQYRDYCEWQQTETYEKRMEEQGEYWVKRFDGLTTMLDLPTDFRRPDIKSSEGDQLLFSFDKELSQRIILAASENNVTLFMYLFAAYTVLLHRYTNQEEIVVGTPTAGRTKHDFEAVVGMFVNTLPLLTRPAGDKVFKDYLQEVKRDALKAFENQEFPFEILLDRLQIPKTTNRNPLFDTMFVLQNTGNMVSALNKSADISFSQIPVQNTLAKFDLMLTAFEDHGILTFEMEYCTSLFQKDTVERMISHYKNILIELCDHSDVLIKDIPIMDRVEYQLVTEVFNKTESWFDDTKNVINLFEEQVSRSPETAAVLFKSSHLTYQELNKRANQLAHYLIQSGVGPNTIVGVMTKRSTDMMIGLYAVLKACGAYLPIDPDYPAARISYILQDSGASYLLTDQQSEIADVFSGQLIDLTAEYTDFSDRNPNLMIRADNLAYVIYTSGSTGNPKGTLIEHSSLTNRLIWMQKNTPIGSKDVVLQKTTFSFDVSVWELFWWGMQGAAVCLMGDGEEKNPVDIINTIVNKRVSVLHFVPTMFTAFLDYVEATQMAAALKSVKYVITSGEALPADLVLRFNRMFKDNSRIALVNLYGPTEATIDVSGYTCPRREFEITHIPIGKPIDNICLYVLDQYGHPQPIGVPGELHIGGVGIARGYLNKPDLTREKFVTSFLGGNKQLYKTADLVKWLPDGNIEYLGRIDYQVKIRGFRVELGEIEEVLRKIDGIQNAVVVPIQNNSSSSLCAYYSGQKNISITELRTALSSVLPDYMVPSYWQWIEEIPLTHSGKINRKELPEPSFDDRAREYIPPRNAMESLLCGIWESVLQKEGIGITHHFFELGGDSIKALQILARLFQHGYKFAIKDLFQYPEIKSLSAFIEPVGTTINDSFQAGELPLTPIQRYAFSKNNEYMSYFNQSVMLFSEHGLAEEILLKAIESVVNHHDALRTSFSLQEDTVIAYMRENQGSFYTLDSTKVDGPDFEKQITIQCGQLQAGVDLGKGPLLKCKLFHTPRGDYLVIIIHHMVIDGVSWRILIEDLASCYEQTLQSNAICLPAKTTSFREWAISLQHYANSEEIKELVQYWQEAPLSSANPLPRDKDLYGLREMGNRNSVSISLSSAATEELQQILGGVNRIQMETVLLAGLGRAIYQWTGSTKTLIELEGHGREALFEDIEVSRTVGFFTSLYPALLDVGEGRDAAEALRKVKETLSSISHGGIGYGLYRYMREMQHDDQPLWGLEPEILFNYLGQVNSEFNNGIFELSSLSSGNESSPERTAWHAIEIVSLIINGRLEVTVHYDSFEFEQNTIENLLNLYQQAMQDIVSCCQTPNEYLLLPSDFGLSLAISKFDETMGTIRQSLSKPTEFHDGVQDIYPLSSTQEGILFHSCDSSPETYFEQISLCIKGSVNAAYLQKSFQQIVNRYDNLRTIFVYDNVPRPLQIVLAKRHLDLHYESIEDKNMDLEAYVRDYERNDRETGFDITKDTLIRCSLFRLNEVTYKLVFSFHHIIMDGWCMSIIFRELLLWYDYFQTGRKPLLDQVTPYRRYIEWLENQNHTVAEAYWTSYLKGFDTPSELPSKTEDREESYQHGVYRLEIDQQLYNGLETIKNEQLVTLNTIIQCVWGALLHQYSASDDVVFGAVLSGRPASIQGIEKMLGLFIHTVPVRFRFKDGLTFTEMMEIRQHEVLESEAYSYTPLTKIQSLASVTHNLFNHILIYENYPIEQLVLSDAENVDDIGFSIESVEAFEQTNYDLNLIVNSSGGLSVTFRYNRAVYEEWLVEQLAGHFEAIVRQVVNNKQIRIRELELLSEKERDNQLNVFNDTRYDYDKFENIVGLFEKQVERTPDLTALVYRDGQLSYQDLNRKANKLAHYLRKQGVGPNTIVGIMMKRSYGLLVGILGILKAGSAYLPLTADLPASRTRSMLQDSSVSMLMTDQPESMNDGYMGRVIALTDSENEAEHNPCNVIDPTDLAYAIYTSGTTGKPKSVMLEHTQVVNFIEAITNAVEFHTGQTILGLTTVTFDIFVLETLVPLSQGLRILLADEQAQQDNDVLCHLLSEYEVHFMQIVPSRLQSLMENKSWAANLDEISTFIIGGEPFPTNLLRLWNQRNEQLAVSGRRIYNLYGPTETTVWSALKELTGEDEITIGKPIANTQIYILGKEKELLPTGVKGELYIGGDGIARGYGNQSELTNDKFITNHTLGGIRMYRTGDLAQWMSNGEIKCYGRLDHQVKILGYRIELEEITSRLLQHQSVSEAVVMKLSAVSKQDILAAFVVGTGYPNLADWEESLVRYLMAELPSYMVPVVMKGVSVIPRLANGKVDFVSLQNLYLPNEESTIVSKPANQTEQIIFSIWADILGTDLFGTDTSFFSLGGNSLDIMRLSYQFKECFHVKIPLSTLFRQDTIQSQALLFSGSMIERISSNESHEQRYMDPQQEAGYYPLSYAQQRFYVLSKFYKDEISYNINEIFLIEGVLDQQKVQYAFEQLIQRHESLRTSFGSRENIPVQKVEETIDFQVEYFEQNDLTIDQILRIFIRPFDLSKAGLFRVGIVQLKEHSCLLILDMHHIIGDAISTGILIRDFKNLYEQQQLAADYGQYKEFALWQNSTDFKVLMEEQGEYWLNKFVGKIPEFKLPTDYERTPSMSNRGGILRYELTDEQIGRMNHFLENYGLTPYMAFLSVFLVFLSRVSGENDVVIGTPVSGRDERIYENVVGMFVNTLVLWNHVDNSNTVEEFVNDVKAATLEAFDNHNYPIDELVKQVCRDRAFGVNPLFNIMFQMEDSRSENISLEGLNICTYEHRVISTFDLTLLVDINGDQVSLVMNYSEELFRKERIELWHSYFTELMEAMFKGGVSTINSLPPFPAMNKLTSKKAETQELETILDITFDF